MTEIEWLTGTDLDPKLEFLRGQASERKLRLFASACCRRVAHLLTDGRSSAAIEVAERCFDEPSGCALPSISTVREKAHQVAGEYNMRLRNATRGERQQRRAEAAAASAAAAVLQQASVWQRATPAEIAARDASHFASLAVKYSAIASGAAGRPPARKERAAQCLLLLDIFGNPFGPTAIDPAWRLWNDGAVVTLAETIYKASAFERMPELADALQQAGCHELTMRDHCRRAGPHVRGCWVLDMLLGKC